MNHCTLRHVAKISSNHAPEHILHFKLVRGKNIISASTIFREALFTFSNIRKASNRLHTAALLFSSCSKMISSSMAVSMAFLQQIFHSNLISAIALNQLINQRIGAGINPIAVKFPSIQIFRNRPGQISLLFPKQNHRTIFSHYPPDPESKQLQGISHFFFRKTKEVLYLFEVVVTISRLLRSENRFLC